MYKLNSFIVLTVLVFISSGALGQNFLQIYPEGKVPNSRKSEIVEKWTLDSISGSEIVTNVTIPALQIFRPPVDQVNGTAVIICPGGAYMKLGMNHSGADIAKAFTEFGITAFVLKYRLPNTAAMIDKTIGPFQDIRRSMQFVKQHAAKWGIDTNRVGVAGFSAGGHLASSIGTAFVESDIDDIPSATVRPAFMILGYPVISFTESLGNKPSRDNLLGRTPSATQIRRFSNEQHVNKDTPPVFIFHAADDRSVPVLSSIEFYKALLIKGVPAEMHIYPAGGHGFGLNNSETAVRWFPQCINWMKNNGWLKLP